MSTGCLGTRACFGAARKAVAVVAIVLITVYSVAFARQAIRRV